jgi:hypothetical protein
MWKKKLAIFFLPALLLISCSNLQSLSTLNRLEKGMSIADVKKAMEVEAFAFCDFNSESGKYDLYSYRIKVGVSTSYSSFSSSARTTSTDIEERYFMLFRSGSLLYWGQLNELWKSEDPAIAKLVPEMLAAYEKKYSHTP